MDWVLVCLTYLEQLGIVPEWVGKACWSWLFQFPSWTWNFKTQVYFENLLWGMTLTLQIDFTMMPRTRNSELLEAVLLWLLCWGGVAQACSIFLTGEAPQVRHTQRVISWSMAERFQLTQTGWKGQNFALDIGTWKPDFACTWSCSNLTLKSIAWAKSIGKVRLWETGKLRISWEWHR